MKASVQSSFEEARSFVSDELAQVDAVIDDRTGGAAGLIPVVSRHIMQSGGKRLRPLMTILSARLCGYEGEGHIPLAAAVEMIHTATLLHDDVVDESTLRRGIPTANTQWGNKASILVGDFLLSQAFQLMVLGASLRILDVLSHASAVIAEGEVMQLASERDVTLTQEAYFSVIESKTAELFASACQVGTIVADVTEAQELALREFGLQLGIAFQLVDDALDYSAKQEQLGKKIGDDFREGKMTLPVILAYQQAADEEEKHFWERVIERDEEAELREGDLEHAIALIQKHKALDGAMQIANLHAQKAKDALSFFPDSQIKQYMIELVEFAVDRPY